MKKVIIFITIILVLFSPRFYWMFKSAAALDIAVVDKTVPKKDYREHNGLFWILENKKIVKPNGELYDIGRDYFGYDPYEQKETVSYDVTRNVDLIYIADTYGVYSDDLQDLPEGERTQKVYGGMDLLEWNAVMESKGKDTTLIAEFNSFAEPTDKVTRKIMERNIGVVWSDWIGRYFKELDSSEIPPWLIRNYENQYKEKWDFKGPGLAFVHTSDRVVVLGKHDVKDFVSVQLTQQGEKQLDGVSSSNYMYWFDIVSPMEGSDILAEYELHLTSKGEEQLIQSGIPTKFPAVVHHAENKTYYFAGDYTDYPKKSLAKWEKAPLLLKGFSNDDSQFYWSTYVPLMNEVIEKIIEQKRW
ncbi:hypothetical protein QYG89_14580 [Bacillus sp. B190/17]|uniref:Uncharacterized protein n=1 Tax=Bacillus lumedeiriae TaxID=3058829 RepID=A0ABW8IBJ6_9BACI